MKPGQPKKSAMTPCEAHGIPACEVCLLDEGERVMGVGQPQGMLLNLFGEQLRVAFGHMAYHVGSSLRQKDGWRDVDVRLMLDDAEWDAFMLGDPANPHLSPRWRTLCIVWSGHGRRMTGLPIDFQLQQRTHGNTEYGKPDHHRSALFVADDEDLRAFMPGLIRTLQEPK